MNKKLFNYIGQLRIYSFLDVLVFAAAFSESWSVVLGVGLAWLGFILYLESRHKDKPRLPVNKFAWIPLFAASLFFLPIVPCALFAFFSWCYTRKKKNGFWGITAPFWRGLQNAALAFVFNPLMAILAFILIFLRNLIADFRDAHDDRQRDIKTIPVALGIWENQAWAFYAHLGLVLSTTLIWFSFSPLGLWLLPIVLILEIASYPLTPRLSNPGYLDIYGKKAVV